MREPKLTLERATAMLARYRVKVARQRLLYLQSRKAPAVAVILASEALRLAIVEHDSLTGHDSYSDSAAAYAVACEA